MGNKKYNLQISNFLYLYLKKKFINLEYRYVDWGRVIG